MLAIRSGTLPNIPRRRVLVGQIAKPALDLIEPG
jgi:hypothetical protein